MANYCGLGYFYKCRSPFERNQIEHSNWRQDPPLLPQSDWCITRPKEKPRESENLNLQRDIHKLHNIMMMLIKDNQHSNINEAAAVNYNNSVKELSASDCKGSQHQIEAKEVGVQSAFRNTREIAIQTDDYKEKKGIKDHLQKDMQTVVTKEKLKENNRRKEEGKPTVNTELAKEDTIHLTVPMEPLVLPGESSSEVKTDRPETETPVMDAPYRNTRRATAKRLAQKAQERLISAPQETLEKGESRVDFPGPVNPVEELNVRDAESSSDEETRTKQVKQIGIRLIPAQGTEQVKIADGLMKDEKPLPCNQCSVKEKSLGNYAEETTANHVSKRVESAQRPEKVISGSGQSIAWINFGYGIKMKYV